MAGGGCFVAVVGEGGAWGVDAADGVAVGFWFGHFELEFVEALAVYAVDVCLSDECVFVDGFDDAVDCDGFDFAAHY